jgi:hypothetical protein
MADNGRPLDPIAQACPLMNWRLADPASPTNGRMPRQAQLSAPWRRRRERLTAQAIAAHCATAFQTG